MLSKTGGIVLDIKETSEGAWLSHKGNTVRFEIRPLSQMLYIHQEGRSSNLVYLWDYKTLIKSIIQPLGIAYGTLSIKSVRAIVQLHNSLVAKHVPAHVQIVLRSQINAGLRQYAPFNDEVAAKMDMYLARDIQNYKVAAAILHLILKFQTDHSKLHFDSYEELIYKQAENWQHLLSATGKAYHALNKTINQWRGTVPKNILRLNLFKLEKPLAASQVRMLIALSESRIEASEYEAMGRIVQNTSPKDIAMLLKMPQLGGNRERMGGRNRDNENYEQAFWNYIHDSMREGMQGEPLSYARMKTLMPLWNRALRIHEEDERRRAAQNRIMQENQRKGHEEWMKTKTYLPKFPLPEISEDEKDGGTIRFLDTVQACHDESNLMHHCVHSYSKQAVMGQSFLFHVEYQGEMATAEVSPSGRVEQVRGPHNHSNRACQYAEQVLSEWVKSWRKVPSKA